MAGDLIVDAQAVHAWYGSSHVLHGVDLQVARGETVGLLGRNGMGKSTLIRTLLGHVTQREGRIVLFGQDASRARPHEVARFLLTSECSNTLPVWLDSSIQMPMHFDRWRCLS